MPTKPVQSENRIPKVRFPGFFGVWERKKVGEIFSFITTNSFSRENLNYKNGKVKNIHYGDIHTKFKTCFDVTRETVPFVNNEIILNKIPSDNYCKEGDLIIADASEDYADIGKCIEIINLNNEKVLAGLHTLQARPALKKFYTGFSGQLMKSNTIHLQIMRIAQGTKVLSISTGRLANIILSIPSLLEQQKIAEFLGLVDLWIEDSRLQKENFELYKMGMMQKIFSQEVRFKDDSGKSFPKWEEKKLGEILKERKEYSIKGKGYPHISLTTKGVVPKSERYDRDFLVGNDETKGYKITRLNDLCYNPANLKFGVISINKLGAGIFSPIYVTFEVVGQNVDFVGYYLIRDAFINKARRYEQGTVYERMAVHPDDFVKVKVLFPSLPEQQKIADLLTSIDKIIEAKQQQITQAGQWKKGLMQRLFV